LGKFCSAKGGKRRRRVRHLNEQNACHVPHSATDCAVKGKKKKKKRKELLRKKKGGCCWKAFTNVLGTMGKKKKKKKRDLKKGLPCISRM